MSTFVLAHDEVDAAATNGGVVHIRDLAPADAQALGELHDAASDRSLYLRFFSLSRATAASFVPTLAAPGDRNHRSIGAFIGEHLVGVADFERCDADVAEFAILIADEHHHGGIGTLLLEHLAAAARGVGISRFTAEVLAENTVMTAVIRDLGFDATTGLDQGVVHVEFPLDATERVVAAIASREGAAGRASMQPLLAPTSIAVVGAGRRSDSAGSVILGNLVEAGFAGELMAVNPSAIGSHGVPAVASALDLPFAPDLAVIAIPASGVLTVARECGERGVKALLVVSAGFAEAGPDGAALQDELLAITRAYGMRLVGPNCVGILNTDPAAHLDTTFAVLPRRPGRIAVLAQSGAFGIGLVNAADHLGMGVAQFVSVGNKADVGGNDLLLAWQHDPRISVICMYLESIGDPLRFARIAREVSRGKPIIAIKSGTTDAGRKAGQSHTAAAASSDIAIDALFHAAGVVRVQTMEQMLDVARVLADQPPPAGPRLAILGNSGGPEILAADAGSAAGLDIVEFDAATKDRLRSLGAPTSNPIDLGAGATALMMRDVLDVLTSSPSVDAVMTVFAEVAVTDTSAVRAAVSAAADATSKPIVSVQVGAPATTEYGLRTRRHVPVFTFPEQAAFALGFTRRYAELRDVPALPVRAKSTGNADAARTLVESLLESGREWLDADDIATVLSAYEIPFCAQRVVRTVEDAVHAAHELGYPVAVKLAHGGIHKTDIGGVRLNIRDDAALTTAATELLDLCASASPAVLVQAMVAGGTELIVGAVHDPQVGPLVMLGAGGVLTDILGDRTFRLAPVTPGEAESMIANLRSARLLDGYRGSPVVPHALVRDVLVRVAALVSDLPEIAELDINPLVCREDAAIVVDARIRIATPPHHPDPLVRQLRGPAGLRA